MNKDQLKNELATLLETITEQFETIYAHQGKIPQIEMDIALNNIRLLYERMIQLNKQNELNDLTSQTKMDPSKLTSSDLITAAVSNVTVEEKRQSIKKQLREIVEPVENIDEKIAIAVSVEEPVALTGEELPPSPVDIIRADDTKPPIENTQEHIAVEAAKHDDLKAARQISKSQKSAASLFDVAPSIGTQFESKPSVKDKIGQHKTEKSVIEKLGKNKIDDLKSAIGINEKFRFINDLFEGVGQSYNESLDKLNHANDINHARQILDSLIAKFNWSNENESFKKFVDLIDRRFL